MAQLWVNLPRRHKMSPPRYQGLLAEQMGLVTLPAGQVRVIAGEYQGVQGPAQTFSPIHVFDVRLEPGGSAEFSFPSNYNAALLVMSGEVSINGSRAAAQGDFVLFDHAGERITLQAGSAAQLLLLSGEPLAEPVVQYGPFVMNTPREIEQAFADYGSGKFGHLDD